MRIAFVVDRSAPFYPGGAEWRIWNLALRLSRNHEVRVFTTLDEREQFVEGVRFVRVVRPLNHLYDSQARSRVHELLFGLLLARDRFGGWSPDIVIVEAIPYIHLLALRIWARDRRFGYVLTVD